MLNNQYYQIS